MAILNGTFSGTCFPNKMQHQDYLLHDCAVAQRYLYNIQPLSTDIQFLLS